MEAIQEKRWCTPDRIPVFHPCNVTYAWRGLSAGTVSRKNLRGYALTPTYAFQSRQDVEWIGWMSVHETLYTASLTLPALDAVVGVARSDVKNSAQEGKSSPMDRRSDQRQRFLVTNPILQTPHGKRLAGAAEPVGRSFKRISSLNENYFTMK